MPSSLNSPPVQSQQDQSLIQQASTHPVAQAVGGSIANATATPIGGSTLLAGSNLAMSQISQNTVGSSEIPALAALLTLAFQRFQTV